MNKSIADLLLSLSMIGANEYGQFYAYDQKVNDCLMNMYFYMMHPNENKKEEYFKEFEKSYNDLNEEQQEMVKQDFIEIIEAQDKNKEKEKVKKKGMNKYE